MTPLTCYWEVTWWVSFGGVLVPVLKNYTTPGEGGRERAAVVGAPCVLDITTSHTKQVKKVAKTTSFPFLDILRFWMYTPVSIK